MTMLKSAGVDEAGFVGEDMESVDENDRSQLAATVPLIAASGRRPRGEASGSARGGDVA
jgi:hypothetical protein